MSVREIERFLEQRQMEVKDLRRARLSARFRAHPKCTSHFGLVRRPHCSGVTSGAGWQDSTARCQGSSAHTIHFSAAAYN